MLRAPVQLLDCQTLLPLTETGKLKVRACPLLLQYALVRNLSTPLRLKDAGLNMQAFEGSFVVARFVLWTTLSCVIALPYHAFSRHRE